MPGGGGEASAPVNDGEFLLQLLQNPPHNPPPQPQPPQPSQILSHDPAVAALGPSLPNSFPPLLQSNVFPPPWLLHHHHNSPPPFAPHNYFVQNPNASPNPNTDPNPNFNSASPPGFIQALQQQQNVQFGYNSYSKDIRELGFLGPNHKPSSAQQQQQQDLIFGSLRGNECVINGNASESLSVSQQGKAKMWMPLPNEGRQVSLGSTRRLDGLEVQNQQHPVDFDREWQGNLSLSRDHERSGSKNTVAVNYGRQGNNVHNYRAAVPPPGFSGKQMTGRNREFANKWNYEQIGERGLNNSAAARYPGHKNEREMERRSVLKNERYTGDRSVDRRVSDRRDCPGPLFGSNFHSVSASNSEESMMKLHDDGEGEDTESIGMREKMRDDHEGHRDIDYLEEQLVDSLRLEDESGEGSNNKKPIGTRDKDYRSDKRGQSLLGQRMRYLKRQLLCPADIDRLDAPFVAIYNSLIPPEEEKAKQEQLVSLLEKIVGKEWPDARLYIYGSCANSFGFSKSDIDVCLTIDGVDVNKSEVLLKLADMLQSENLQNVQALTRARVPIVKLMDPSTGISCDICVNNILAVINTKLLQDYAQIDVRLRQLAFIVKHWAKSRGVNETYQGTLSSYAYVLMCIHFLQQRRPPILPCLQEMKTTHYVTVDNIVCAYFDQVKNLVGFGSHNRESIAQLVWAFFNYWAYRHDYANDVISVRTGSILSKRSKDWTRRIGNDRHLICIEDPFEVTHDLGRVVDKRSIKVLREEFERAAEIMQYDLNPCQLGRVVDKRRIKVLREEFERAAEIMQYDLNPCVRLFEPYIPT